MVGVRKLAANLASPLGSARQFVDWQVGMGAGNVVHIIVISYRTRLQDLNDRSVEFCVYKFMHSS